MIKKILKLIAVAQAVAFPAIKYPVQKADNSETTLETTLQATNILYQNAVVDSLFITYPKDTKDIVDALGHIGFTNMIVVSPVSNLTLELTFQATSTQTDWPYNGLSIVAWGNEDEFKKLENYIDTSNLKTYSLSPDGRANVGIFFGDVKNVPQGSINKNVLLNFKEPVFVRYVAPGIEKYVFNPKPVDKFALTYNGLLNGYAYNLLGGREDIDKKRFREYLKNRVTLQTDGFWKGEATFTIATFKNGTEEFEIVGWIADYPNSTNVSIATNYKAKSISGIKLLCGYIFNDAGEVISEATNSTNIDKYYTCTIVDETAAKYVLTSGPDFSAFLDYAKSVGYPDGYAQGFTDGQNNPTFKSFIVSAFEACSAFFNIPVLGANITIGTLIGSFVGLGALFLLIRLFR